MVRHNAVLQILPDPLVFQPVQPIRHSARRRPAPGRHPTRRCRDPLHSSFHVVLPFARFIIPSQKAGSGGGGRLSQWSCRKERMMWLVGFHSPAGARKKSCLCPNNPAAKPNPERAR
jgi:hypothetical protein